MMLASMDIRNLVGYPNTEKIAGCGTQEKNKRSNICARDRHVRPTHTLSLSLSLAVSVTHSICLSLIFSLATFKFHSSLCFPHTTLSLSPSQALRSHFLSLRKTQRRKVPIVFARVTVSESTHSNTPNVPSMVGFSHYSFSLSIFSSFSLHP